MGLFLNSEVNSLFVGSQNVSAVYMGSRLVWTAGVPAGTTWDFSYTGTVQEVTLPRGTYKLQCWGAEGGRGEWAGENDQTWTPPSSKGGKGGYSEGILTLPSKKTLYIFVGGKGALSGKGGWNGGGYSIGSNETKDGVTFAEMYFGCGGGATDIALVSSSMDYGKYVTNRSSESLLSRLIVAGGGGGGQCGIIGDYTEGFYYYTDLSVDYDPYYGGYVNKAIGLDPYETYMIKTPSYGYDGATSFDVHAYGYGSTADDFTIPFDTSFRLIDYVNHPNNCNCVFIFTADYYNFGIYKYRSWPVNVNKFAYKGGYGGGLRGEYGGDQTDKYTTSYEFGIGESQTSYTGLFYTGAGGGGWYGGSCVHANAGSSRSSGGGSGYVYTEDTVSSYPEGCLLDSSYYLTQATTTGGNNSFESPTGEMEKGHTGNGYVRITSV